MLDRYLNDVDEVGYHSRSQVRYYVPLMIRVTDKTILLNIINHMHDHSKISKYIDNIVLKYDYNNDLYIMRICLLQSWGNVRPKLCRKIFKSVRNYLKKRLDR